VEVAYRSSCRRLHRVPSDSTPRVDQVAGPNPFTSFTVPFSRLL